MPENHSGNSRLGEWIILGAMALGVAAGTAMTDVDPALVLHNQIATNTEDDFDDAKQIIYNDLDVENNSIRCRYSDTTVTLTGTAGKMKPPTDQGVQVEHTWASLAKWVPQEYRFKRDSVPGADLHHLFAVRRGPNASRGNHPFGALSADKRQLFIDVATGKLADPSTGTASGSFRDKNVAGVTVFQPREDHRGNVARAMFYMSVRYWMPITEEMEADLRTWHEEDPVDQEERTRNDRIQNLQGNRNPFIDDPSQVDEVEDF